MDYPQPKFYSDIYNSELFASENESLTIAAADQRYLKKVGGVATSLSITDKITFSAGPSILTNTEAAYLTSITSGTATASKALVVDANKRLDTLDITALEIGNVAVSSSAAELNLLDGVLSTTAEIDQRALSWTMTLGTANSDFIVIPYACTVTTIYTVITAAIATGDEVITFKNNAGSAMANGVLTIANAGSAAGDIDSVSPTTNNTFTAGYGKSHG